MLEAYIDESKHGKYVLVGGLIARDEQWGAVIDDWDSLFRKNGIEYFHSIEFQSSTGHYRHLNFTRRQALLNKLTASVRRNIPMGIRLSIHEGDFNKALAVDFRSQIGTAYTIAGTSAVILSSQLLNDDDVGLDVSWTFENGHPNEEQLKMRMGKLMASDAADVFHIDRYGFGRKRKSIPLQAADMYIYGMSQRRGLLGSVHGLLVGKRPGVRNLTNHYDLELSPSLIRAMYVPLYELERHMRAVSKHARKRVRQIFLAAKNEAEADEMVTKLIAGLERWANS